ncbi:MAG: hypothetical protein KBS69_01200 [Bacteroidales bacterium]|nr:hypothetical protein [Candidatus Colicola caccequi]
MRKFDEVIQFETNGQLYNHLQVMVDGLMDEETTIKEVSSILNSPYGHLLSLDDFLKCIQSFINRRIIYSLRDSVYPYFSKFYRLNTNIITSNILGYLISNDGDVRMIGRHLWDQLKLVESVQLNISTMDEITQMKYISSLLQDLLSPEDRVPISILFFNSRSKDVRSVLMNYLSMYLMNYYGYVKTQFEQQTFPHYKEVLQFKALIADFDERFCRIDKCKELHAEYAYPRLHEICIRKSAEHMADTVSKRGVSQHTFLSMLKNVSIGRAGGIRQPDGSVQTLAKISCSVFVPMYLQSFTPEEQREISKNVSLDWSKIQNNG